MSAASGSKRCTVPSGRRAIRWRLCRRKSSKSGIIDHRGERVHARKIEYRSLSAAGVAADNTLRAVVWVGDDGTVLRQDVHLMDAKLRFERCMEPDMLKLAEKLLDIDSVATIAAPPFRVAMIEFQQVYRSYGDKVAVENLNLRVAAGELYALLGHNGAGKTTAIKMLVGLIRPGSGTVRVGGYDLVTKRAKRPPWWVMCPISRFCTTSFRAARFCISSGRMYGMDNAAGRTGPSTAKSSGSSWASLSTS